MRLREALGQGDGNAIQGVIKSLLLKTGGTGEKTRVELAESGIVPILLDVAVKIPALAASSLLVLNKGCIFQAGSFAC